MTSIAFLIIAGLLGELIRTQLATPNGTLLNPFSYDQVVTLHGLLMILWVLSPLAVGLANYIVPLQIGAKDLAFPRLNATSYWAYLFSGVLLVGTVIIPGGGADTGWTLYAPLNTIQFSPQPGATLAILALALLAVSVTMSSVNFITTIVRNRAKGVTWKRLPIFTWSILMTMALMLFAFPPLGRRASSANYRQSLWHCLFQFNTGRVNSVGSTFLVFRTPRSLHNRASRNWHNCRSIHDLRQTSSIR